MKEYVLGLLALCVCCAVVELLAPQGEGGGIAGHIKLMSALCLLCALVVPLKGAVTYLADLPAHLQEWMSQWEEKREEGQREWEERWQGESERLDVSYAEQTVALMLRERFSLADADCRVTLVTDGTQGAIAHVRVALSGAAVWVDSHAMEDYIQATFGCDSTIYIE